MKAKRFWGVLYGITALFLFSHLWWRTGSETVAPAILVTHRSAGQAALWDTILLGIYFITHSVLASTDIKSKIQKHAKMSLTKYRRFYLAMTLIASVFLWALWAPFHGAWIWQISTGVRPLFYLIQLVGLIGFLWTTRHFNLKEFFGTQATKEGEFTARGPYALCRHPLYFFGILTLWGTPLMTSERLLFTVLSTVYLFIGSRIEEQKLVNELGTNYKKYRRATPWIIPTPKSLREAFASRQSSPRVR